MRKLRLVTSSVCEVTRHSVAECDLNPAPSPARLTALWAAGPGRRGSGWEVGGDQRGGGLTQDWDHPSPHRSGDGAQRGADGRTPGLARRGSGPPAAQSSSCASSDGFLAISEPRFLLRKVGMTTVLPRELPWEHAEVDGAWTRSCCSRPQGQAERAGAPSGGAPAGLTEAATSRRAPDEARSSVLGSEPDPQQTSLAGDGGPAACWEAIPPADPSEGLSGTRTSTVTPGTCGAVWAQCTSAERLRPQPRP